MPPGPTCNGLELMAEFRQMQLPAKNGRQVDHKDPTPTPAATSCPRGATPRTRSSAPHPVDRQPQVQAPGDFSSSDLVLPGPVWVTPKGPAQGGTAGPHPTWRRRSPQGWISPTRPPRRPWVTISQHEPVFLGRHKDTQWKQVPYVTVDGYVLSFS